MNGMRQFIGITGIAIFMLSIAIIPASVYMKRFSIWSCIAGIIVLLVSVLLASVLAFFVKLACS